MLACGTQSLSGRLLAINPHLEKTGSATISALLPDGRCEIIAWIRDYDPRYPTTYWLRTPLALPRGSRLEIAPTGECGDGYAGAVTAYGSTTSITNDAVVTFPFR